MSCYHIIIQQEHRSPRVTEFGEDRSRLALQISTSVPTGNTVDTPMGSMPEYVAGPAQLHTLSSANLSKTVGEGLGAVVLPPDFSDPQYVGVFEWDGQSPYIIQHKGDYSARTMGYAGWPELTKEQFDALPAAAVP